MTLDQNALANWRRLQEPAIRAFIAAQDAADLRTLALRKPPGAGWPYKLILDQIAARQKAARKLPDWLAIAGLVLPPATVIEQASSQATARYKASLFQGTRFADLTAGAGVDCAAFLARFDEGIAVEADGMTAAALAHNLPLLSSTPCQAWPRPAEEAVAQLPPCDLIYVDPQRRDTGRRGLFQLEDCTPDILALLPALLEKAPVVLLKTSPMLDIDRAIALLGNVAAVHVVEWRGECREVLYALTKTAAVPDAVPIHAVILTDDGSPRHDLCFTRQSEQAAAIDFALPGRYLFEPSPALQKAGAWRSLAAAHGLAKLHPHTHLLTGGNAVEDFPGRVFTVSGVYGAGGKDLPVRQANLTVRNFPMEAEALRRKLGLRDGGDDYLFACTLMDGRKALIHGRKA